MSITGQNAILHAVIEARNELEEALENLAAVRSTAFSEVVRLMVESKHTISALTDIAKENGDEIIHAAVGTIVVAFAEHAVLGVVRAYGINDDDEAVQDELIEWTDRLHAKLVQRESEIAAMIDRSSNHAED